jgi:membrane protein YqaA with SNARE-associated domain
MFEFIKNIKIKILDLLYKEEDSLKRSNFLMGALSFAESSFFPIPPDFFIFPLVMRKPERWFKMALIVTISSVVGGLFGYLIGFVFFEFLGKPLIAFYHLENQIQVVGNLFKQNAFLAIFTAAFTPIPYKVFTIAAGFASMALLPFVLASCVGRGARFFLVAGLMAWGGEKMEHRVRGIVEWLGWGLILLIALWVGYKSLT